MLQEHDITPSLDPATLYENWIHAEKQCSDLEAEKSLWCEKEKSLHEENERLRALLIQMKQQAYGRKSDKLNLDPMTPLPGFENVFDEIHAESTAAASPTPQEGTEAKAKRPTALARSFAPCPSHS